MIQSLFAKAAGQTLEACLANERTAAIKAAQHPDFIEGVRAVLVDKDRNPTWS
jgi:enoyl-CoA hydratase